MREFCSPSSTVALPATRAFRPFPRPDAKGRSALTNESSRGHDGTKTNDATLPDLQKQRTAVTAQRETLFKGETLALLALAGFLHAFTTPKNEVFASPRPDRKGIARDRELIRI